ncbi:hypothetical protein IRJ41_016963, partial [Triplophysa rosa]
HTLSFLLSFIVLLFFCTNQCYCCEYQCFWVPVIQRLFFSLSCAHHRINSHKKDYKLLQQPKLNLLVAGLHTLTKELFGKIYLDQPALKRTKPCTAQLCVKCETPWSCETYYFFVSACEHCLWYPSERSTPVQLCLRVRQNPQASWFGTRFCQAARRLRSWGSQMELRGGAETASASSQSPSHSAFGRDSGARMAASPAPSESSMHALVLRTKRDRTPCYLTDRCKVCCTKYHCAYCKSAFNHLHELQNHVNNHMVNAVQQEDFIIIKCGLNCRPTPHFHCCYCNSIVIRRDGFIKHLKTCRSMTSRQRPLPTAEPPPSLASAAPPPSPALTAPPLLVSAVPPPSPASTAAPASPVPPPSQASAAPPLLPVSAVPPPSPASTAAPPSVASPVPPPSQASAALPLLPASLVPPLSPASTAAQPSPVPPPSQASEAASTVPTPPASQRLRARQQVRVTCTHCGISINQRNLQVHINRKHRQRVIEITPKRHLSCQCIDAKNGIFAVDKSFFKPCSPIHVQKQTWGASQKIICELDECNANAEFAVRSGIVPYECIHLRSLLFCPRSDTTPIILEVEVLSEMVASRLFGEARKQSCLNQQKAATDAGVPLSVEVTVGGPASKKLISIYEPKVSYHSRLGRVIAAYDSKKKSWHCPCAKARQSCLHKAIAKWHLFKTDRQLFMTAESDVRPDSAVSHQDTQESVCKAKPGEDAGQAYPPDDAGLRRMVHYLMQKKGLPAQLPQHLVTGSRSLQDLPRQLMPKETSCVECAGHLSEPMLITANAKLVTYTGVVDGKTSQKYIIQMILATEM